MLHNLVSDIYLILILLHQYFCTDLSCDIHKYTMEAISENPKIVLLFSGKRKSGKDFLTDHLQVGASTNRKKFF